MSSQSVIRLLGATEKKWRTRVDLANAIFALLEIFYNRQRRHSQLGYSMTTDHELCVDPTSIPT